MRQDESASGFHRGGTGTQEMRERAIQFNHAGYRIFPVDEDNRPLCGKGYLGNDPFPASQVAKWPWSRARVLGWAVPSRIVIFDVDTKNGKCGEEQLAQAEDLLGALPDTAWQRTPSGGRHLKFQVPGGGDLGDRIWIGGKPTDIEILDRAHRYAKVYDEGFLSAPAAELPEAWLTHLISGLDRLGSRGPRPTAGWTLETMRAAPIGTRNNTLNNVALRGASTGPTGAALRDQLQEAAQESGLSADESRRTIDSAFRAAGRSKADACIWLAGVTTHVLSQVRGTGLTLVAEALATAAVRFGRTFGMSCRQLAELTGLSYVQASKHLKRLVLEGWLKITKRSDEGTGATYALSAPGGGQKSQERETNVHSVNTPMGGGGSGGVLTQRTFTLEPPWRTIELASHSAFIRHGPGPSLPRSAVRTLQALEAAPGSAKALAETTGLSVGAMRRTLRILESAGLVLWSRRGDARLLGSDPIADLDRWTEQMGVQDRAQTKRETHAAQRSSYRRRNEPGSTRPEVCAVQGCEEVALDGGTVTRQGREFLTCVRHCFQPLSLVLQGGQLREAACATEFERLVEWEAA